MNKIMRAIILGIAFVILLLPLVPLVMWSLASFWRWPTIVPEFDGGYWGEMVSAGKILPALRNSLLLTVTVVTVSLAMSFFAAKNLGTKKFRGKRLIEFLLLVPSFVPGVTVVFGMQIVFIRLGLYSNFLGLVAAHLVFYVPYMVLLLSAVFENYDTSLEEQAATLGVGPLKTLFTVTLPAVRPGVIVSCVFCFIGSWSVYLLNNIIASPHFKTLPVIIFPLLSVGNNSYSMVAVAIIVYILPLVLLVLAASKSLVDHRLDPKKGSML
jgi:ABC-type spermidine/putrescine transport system permease subunit II